MSDTNGVADGTFGVACDTRDAVSFAALEPAVAEAVRDMRRLHRALDDGLSDNHESTRAKIARQTGVPVSYLKRLHQRASEMPDVSGKWARALRLACERLDARTARLKHQTGKIEHELSTIRGARARRRGEARGGADQVAVLEKPGGDRTMGREA
ncbi:hypothetical protein [Jiella avicenniae]|uniref:Uncharacterized protein n=1 Tax=Jiella avicenniae TaxID=2907202 RepID=A0A9X1NVS1_9HYPH|nr:hypothetical protein [Jiella avicenniae]MCE7026402.1 hypothetical protein [Jiella avicenniae]